MSVERGYDTFYIDEYRSEIREILAVRRVEKRNQKHKSTGPHNFTNHVRNNAARPYKGQAKRALVKVNRNNNPIKPLKGVEYENEPKR